MGEQPLSTSVTLRPLALTNRRAVGGPVSRQLLAAYFGVALTGWLAATSTEIAASPVVEASVFGDRFWGQVEGFSGTLEALRERGAAGRRTR
jgi:hypothetical protein